MTEAIIVVPCFNEAERLDVEAFRAYVATNPDVSFLFVDDGSTDATRSVLEGLCAGDESHFDVLVLERNSGKAEAVRMGINKALEAKPAFVAYWDADLSTPLAEIGRFIAVMRERPQLVAVLGSRVRRLGADVRRQAVRHYLGRVFATFASLVLGLAVYDTQCGAKMFRACDEVAAAFGEPFMSRWIFDVELLARLISARRARADRPPIADALFEQPLARWRDIAGSKLRSGHMLVAAGDLWRIRSRYPRRGQRGV